MASKKVYVPLPPPPTNYTEDPRAVLSEAEQINYDEVLAQFGKEDPPYTLPGIEKGELQDHEKFWLSRECILRFLRASKWKKEVAITRLEKTLKWRREFGIYDVVNAKHVEPEAVTGKEIAFGYDVKGRPGFYMIPSRQNTDEATRQIQFTFWMIERCIDLMEPGVENITLLINFADRAKNPAIGTARAVINVPFLVNAFFKIIMPFVDPVTRDKVKFNPKVLEEGYFTPDMVMKEWWNGEQDFEYVHEKYWSHLVEMCEERAKAQMKNWRKLGGKVGVSEWEYKTMSKGFKPALEKDKDSEVTVTAVDASVQVTITADTPGALAAVVAAGSAVGHTVVEDAAGADAAGADAAGADASVAGADGAAE